MRLLFVSICVIPLVYGAYRVNLGKLVGAGARHGGAKGQSEAIDRPGCQGADRKYAPVNINGLKRCQFFECDGYEYLMRLCPDGMSVPTSFGSKETSGDYPCVVPNKKCERSMLEKGVGDVDVNVCGIDLAFICDISCSISPEDKEKVKDFIIAVTRRLPVRPAFTQVSGVSYSKTVYPLLQFTSANKQKDVLNLIRQNLKTGKMPTKDCGTSTYLALRAAREDLLNEKNGNRPGRKDVVVLMTDGVSFPPEDTPKAIAEAKKLRDAGATVILLTLPNFTPKQRTEEEEEDKARAAEIEFSSFPTSKKHRWDVTSFDNLTSIVNDLASMSCFVM